MRRGRRWFDFLKVLHTKTSVLAFILPSEYHVRNKYKSIVKEKVTMIAKSVKEQYWGKRKTTDKCSSITKLYFVLLKTQSFFSTKITFLKLNLQP